MRWKFSITTGQTALLRHPSLSNDPDFLQASRGSCLICCRPVMSQDCDLPLSFFPLLPFYSFTRNSPCPSPSPSPTGSGRHSWLASSTFQLPLFKAIKRKRGRRWPQPLVYPNPLAAVQTLLPQGLAEFGTALTRTVLSVHMHVQYLTKWSWSQKGSPTTLWHHVNCASSPAVTHFCLRSGNVTLPGGHIPGSGRFLAQICPCCLGERRWRIFSSLERG